MSSPMIISVSSSAAVRNIIGTFETLRIFLQISYPEPSGSVTSKITRSYFPFIHNFSASRLVRATSISYPCFLIAKDNPLIKLKSSSTKKCVSFFYHSRSFLTSTAVTIQTYLVSHFKMLHVLPALYYNSFLRIEQECIQYQRLSIQPFIIFVNMLNFIFLLYP